jgi:imidazolonepropionase-like amidohydrolase
MTPVLSGSAALYLHVSAARDIEDAVLFAKSYQIPRIVLVGAEESDQVIPFLKKHGVSVILSRVHRLPDLPDQTPDEIYSQAARLQQGGILVALSYDGDMEAMGTRNLPFLAGTVSAYGVSETEALNMISLNPARITGIDHHFGSLTTGKKAMFFLTKGNALDMKTAGATRIWMLGLEVSNDNLQKELYRKYMHKYGKDEFIRK